MEINQICKLVETYTKQLEGLAFSKNAAMATRLSGAIDTAIQIAGIGGEAWARRIQIAMNNIMAEQPKASALPDNLPPPLASAVSLPTPPPAAPVAQVPAGNVVPLPKVQ
jgi:hypothetical protein